MNITHCVQINSEPIGWLSLLLLAYVGCLFCPTESEIRPVEQIRLGIM
jgi:hypothetical protein